MAAVLATASHLTAGPHRFTVRWTVPEGKASKRDVKHLRWLEGRLGDQILDSVIVTTGPEAYRRADGIAVIPAALLGP